MIPGGLRRVTPADLIAYRDYRRTHQIYRCYDADGVLLYIGCTSEVGKRMASHRRGDRGASRWLSVCMDRYEVDADTYEGRIAGQEAEARAIRAERPVFNQQHNLDSLSGRRRGSDAARYLVDHGHLQLALETTCICWGETRDEGKCDPWCTAHVTEGVLEVVA